MSAPSSGRASLLTSVGRGAVAVVATEGEAALAAIDASFVAANGRSIRQQLPERIVFGHWASGLHCEEVIVVRDAASGAEIHCHGGVAAAERILTALAAAGCHIEAWQARVERLASSTIEAEADMALARCVTRRTASILLAQREGALRREVDAIRDDLASKQHESSGKRIDALLARAPLGLRLTEPWRVAIAGQPNVGKSSLMNALVGYQRAIVFDQPGTTRDVLTAETAIDGWPVRLADAAGIRDTDDALEAEGVLRARRQLAQADLTLWLLDGSQLAGDPLETMNRQWREATEQPVYSSQVLTVVNKADLMPPGASETDAEGVQFVSALTGAGLTELVAAIGRILVPVEPQDDAIPFTSRQIELLSAAHASIKAGHLNEAVEALSRL